MKVVIVGLDDLAVVDMSKNLASTLGFKCLNFDSEFEKVLLTSKDYPLIEIDVLLERKEKMLIEYILKFDDIVLAISNNSYLSNENYKLFKDDVTICVEKEENEKILKNLQNLIKKHCKISINQQNYDISMLIDEIKKYY